MALLVERIHEDAVIPVRATVESAGYDLFCLEAFELKAGERCMVPLGIRIRLPVGTYGRITPRSSLGSKGIDVLAGVVDSDYRGEVKVLLINLSHVDVSFTKGQAVAQLIIEKILLLPVADVSHIEATSYIVMEGVHQKREGGFGSTGV